MCVSLSAGAHCLVAQGVQQQLQRIELLVKIQQYDTARMQLRQGSFKSLRSDLRYESEYRGVQPEVRAHTVVQLNALRGREEVHIAWTQVLCLHGLCCGSTCAAFGSSSKADGTAISGVAATSQTCSNAAKSDKDEMVRGV